MSKIIYTERLIADFKVKIFDRYPTLDPKDIDKLCRAQFRMAKEVMEEGYLEEIRLQYLFVLKVSPQRILKQLNFMSHYIPGDTMDADKHEFYMNMVLRFIQQNQNKFIKYEDKIREYTGKSIREISRGTYPNNGYSSST
jgi:hypothetical protein